MSGDFFDSNVLVYSMTPTEPRKGRTAEQLLHDSERPVISFQVVQEILNVLTRQNDPPAAASDIQQFFEDVLLPFWRIMPSRRLYERALELHYRYKYNFYDSLIIAAALEAGCERLLSEDLQHGQRIEGLTIVNPFLEA